MTHIWTDGARGTKLCSSDSLIVAKAPDAATLPTALADLQEAMQSQSRKVSGVLMVQPSVGEHIPAEYYDEALKHSRIHVRRIPSGQNLDTVADNFITESRARSQRMIAHLRACTAQAVKVTAQP